MADFERSQHYHYEVLYLWNLKRWLDLLGKTVVRTKNIKYKVDL